MMRMSLCCLLLFGTAIAAAQPETTLTLPSSEMNRRNSEGDFIALKDGRVLFVYTHFFDGTGDHAAAHLAGRFSRDGGKTWDSEDTLILGNEGGMNLMSVSLLRLQDNRIALFYLRKNSTEDCRPLVRFSSDEANTWSDAVVTIPDSEMGYYVLNNDRAVQLSTGRIVLPVSEHNRPHYEKLSSYGIIRCYFSDDGGATWQRSESALDGKQEDASRVMLQEPGVVELKDGRLMMYMRTDGGCQYLAYSKDGGDHWTKPEPSTLLSPRSPAVIERIPSRNDLLIVWNNHDGIDPALKDRRTPQTIALSEDDGKSWTRIRNLDTSPKGCYCYTAVVFVGDHVLLGYSAEDHTGNNSLQEAKVVRLPLDGLYATE
jgi:sialidase-1